MSDDLTDILGAAYATYPRDGRIRPGVVCIAVIPYVMDKFWVIRPLNPDPSAPDHKHYRLQRKQAHQLAADNQAERQVPVKDLNLDADEDIVLVKVKRRPVVVLSKAIIDERKTDPSRFQDSFWCVPSYTMRDQFWHPQISSVLIEDIMALRYRCCFPLPYDSVLHDREAMLRFDRFQPVPRHLLQVTERRVSPAWLLYLLEWTRFYMTDRLGDDDSDKNPSSVASTLKEARDVFMSVLAEERAKKQS